MFRFKTIRLISTNTHVFSILWCPPTLILSCLPKFIHSLSHSFTEPFAILRRMIPNFSSSCLCLLSAVITGVCSTGVQAQTLCKLSKHLTNWAISLAFGEHPVLWLHKFGKSSNIHVPCCLPGDTSDTLVRCYRLWRAHLHYLCPVWPTFYPLSIASFWMTSILGASSQNTAVASKLSIISILCMSSLLAAPPILLYSLMLLQERSCIHPGSLRRVTMLDSHP